MVEEQPALLISPLELLKAGAHFGHKVSRWNPKMEPYLFGKRNQIHILNIKETLKGVVQAYHFLRQIAQRGDLVLFVGTKRQASAVIEAEARRCNMPFVAERWLGGTLTNYVTVRQSLKRLKEIEEWEKNGLFVQRNKKEQASILREKRKLRRNLEGIRTMDRLPTALVIVDPKHEKNAVKEAERIKAATLALIDTDSDPEPIDISIPVNDDSIKVIQLVIGKLADAVIEGQSLAFGVSMKGEAEAVKAPTDEHQTTGPKT